MNEKQRCYEKSIKGLAEYASNLSFTVNIDLLFKENIIKRIDEFKKSHIEIISDAKAEFKPIFSSFYSDNECLVNILIPKFNITIRSELLGGIGLIRFDTCINEFFIDVLVSSNDLESYNLGFKEFINQIESEIIKHCNEHFKKLSHGVWDNKKKCFATCDYDTCEISLSYS